MTDSTPLVWITGAGGLIADALLRAALRRDDPWRVVGSRHATLDVTDRSAVVEMFERLQPSMVIHCAAMTRIAACERDPAEAHRVNVEATAHLADLARDIPFVVFSTDLVFDGERGWYDEDAEVRPHTVYAKTKVEAERIVLANPRHTVIRTSLNAGRSANGNRAFNEEMYRAWQAGHTLHLFTDEFRCPIPASVTAQAVWELVARGKPGLYHLAGAERLSRWDIGECLARYWPDVTARRKPASRLDLPGPPRPRDTSLDCGKLQRLLSFRLPAFSAWLLSHPNEL
ncbi:SDR family oxidoreductase [Candidatus Nitrospira bockiana]